MFGTGAVELSIELNSEKYAPGDKVVGTLSVNTEAPLSMESISVAIEGIACTRASYTEESRRLSDRTGESSSNSSSTKTAYEAIEFMKKSVVVFPPPYYAQGLSQSCLTIQEGLHKYNFEFLLPMTCETSDDPHWSHLPLPGTCKFPYGRGEVKYAAVATVHRKRSGPGLLFTTSPQGKQAFEVVTVSHANAETRQLFARRALSVPIFQQSVTWPSTFKRALGFSEPVCEQKMTAEMRVPAHGFHVYSSDSPVWLADLLKLTLTRHGSGQAPDGKSTMFVVNYLKISLVANYRVQAKHAIETFEQSSEIYKSRGLEWPLTFQDNETTDLGELLAGLELKYPATETLTLPKMQVAYKLCVDLGVAPTVGHPVVSMHANLKVNIPVTPRQAAASPPAYSEAAGPTDPPIPSVKKCNGKN